MADTVETLRADLDALKAEFDEFKNYATPVVEGHQLPPTATPVQMLAITPFTVPTPK